MSWQKLQEYANRNNVNCDKVFCQQPRYCPTSKVVHIWIAGRRFTASEKFSGADYNEMLESLSQRALKLIPKSEIIVWEKIRQHAETNGLKLKHKYNHAELETDADHWFYEIYVQVGENMYREQCRSDDHSEQDFYKKICNDLKIDYSSVGCD